MMIGKCKLCGEECESVVHVLWECPVYDTIRNSWKTLANLLGGSLKSLVHSVLLRYDFKALLRLVKSFISLIWGTRKNKLYGNQDSTGETSGCFCSCPLIFQAPPVYVGAWSMA